MIGFVPGFCQTHVLSNPSSVTTADEPTNDLVIPNFYYKIL